MKKQLQLPGPLYLRLTLAALLTILKPVCAQTKPSKSPVGRWERTLPNGGAWIWTIRANGTFSVSSKGKAFVNGHYRIQNGIYEVNDANCNEAYRGRYRFAFFASDSLKFTIIEDTCRTRRGGMNGTGWKRLSDTE